MGGEQRGEPPAKALGRARVAAEARDAERRLARDGLTEERERRENDGEEGVFVGRLLLLALQTLEAQRMGDLPDLLPVGAGLLVERVVAGQEEPGHQAGVPAIEQGLEDVLEERCGVGSLALLGLAEGPDEVLLKRDDRLLDDGVDEPLPAPEVVQHGGVGDAHVGGDVLEPEPHRARLREPSLRGLEDLLGVRHRPCAFGGVASSGESHVYITARGPATGQNTGEF